MTLGAGKMAEKTNIETEVWIDDEYSELIESREWMEVPERRLLYAILERAVRDAMGSNIEESLEAREWLYGGGGSSLFSFGWICDALDIGKERFLSRVTALLNKKTFARHYPKFREEAAQLLEGKVAA